MYGSGRPTEPEPEFVRTDPGSQSNLHPGHTDPEKQVLEDKLGRSSKLIENLIRQVEDIPDLKRRIRDLEQDQVILERKLDICETELAARNAELAWITKTLLAEEERLGRERRTTENLLQILRALHGNSPWWWVFMPNSWRWNRLSRKLASRGLFDAMNYVDQYPDVAFSRQSPLRHYIFHGIEEIHAGTR